MFISAAVGVRNDFFGFSDGHDEVGELNLSVGHRNLFATLSEQHSGGGDVIASARGQSLAITAQGLFSPAPSTSLTVSARTDRFLGGEAGIAVGRIDLDAGGWDHRLSVVSETELGGSAVVSASASMLFPESGDDDYSVGAGLRWYF